MQVDLAGRPFRIEQRRVRERIGKIAHVQRRRELVFGVQDLINPHRRIKRVRPAHDRDDQRHHGGRSGAGIQPDLPARQAQPEDLVHQHRNPASPAKIAIDVASAAKNRSSASLFCTAVTC